MVVGLFGLLLLVCGLVLTSRWPSALSLGFGVLLAGTGAIYISGSPIPYLIVLVAAPLCGWWRFRTLTRRARVRAAESAWSPPA